MNSKSTRRVYPDPTKNIGDLNAKLAIDVRNTLDGAGNNRDCRAFISSLSNDTDERFHYKHHEVERLANTVHSGGSFAGSLLSDLVGKGCTIGMLTKHLNILKLESLVLRLKPSESLRILAHPESLVKVKEGQGLKLAVEATGLPYPRYQWYAKFQGKDYKKLEGKVENVLNIASTSLLDTGIYCCQVYNDTVNLSTEMSDVTVLENPVKVTGHGSKASLTVYERQAIPGQINGPIPMEDVGLEAGSDQIAFKYQQLIDFPSITQCTGDCLIEPNQNVKFEIRAVGAAPLIYYWYKDGQYLTYSIENFHEVDKFGSKHCGVYQCIVKNQYGTVKAPAFTAQLKEDIAPLKSHTRGMDKIMLQPQNVTVDYGGTAKFQCRVQTSNTGCVPTFQWFKDNNPIEGATQDFYEVKIADNVLLYSGTYLCLIKIGHNTLTSNGAKLTITQPKDPAKRQYRATDKVALLIGIMDYRSAPSLKASGNDISTLRKTLEELGFSVVTLLNLNLTEMRNEISEFCALIGEGAYCFFCFCGHGFEEFREQYMVPEDVPSNYTQKDCLSVYHVIDKIAEKKPALMFLVLDMCRRRNPIPGSPPKRIDFDVSGSNDVRANRVCLYATSYKLEAYEEKIVEKGILVPQLAEQMAKTDLSVREVITNVKDAIGKLPVWKRETKDPETGKMIKHCQIPEVVDNTNEDRCLSDLLASDGFTKEVNVRRYKWAEISEVPPRYKASVDALGIELELDFQMEFNNVLKVFASTKHITNATSQCTPRITQVPISVSIRGESEQISTNKTKTIIQDLQRLKLEEDLVITICLDYVPADSNNMHNTELSYNIGRPLISKLNLNMNRMQPVENSFDQFMELNQL